MMKIKIEISEVYTRAWKLPWKFKVLWFFGILSLFTVDAGACKTITISLIAGGILFFVFGLLLSSMPGRDVLLHQSAVAIAVAAVAGSPVRFRK